MLTLKKTATNIDAQMNSMLTKCGALMTSEECTQHGKRREISKVKSMISPKLIKLTPRELILVKAIGSNTEYCFAVKLIIIFYLNHQ